MKTTFVPEEYPVVLRDVSKVYRLYAKPVDRMKELLLRRPFHREFWALKDIGFTLKRSETFGVIGENGAGKSTLLKIIAGTILPTSGSVEVKGKVSALLELGAAFHPDLSGRENVFMQAAILGLSQREIEERYKDIVEFSELDEATMERPVKTYSSGMFVRLGFAIATCVSPEVLVVDEALSVGDIHFQKKSLDRIMGFRKAGKTILFCSHNMYQVRSLCQRALWLKEGQMQAFGPTEDVVAEYEAYQRKKEKEAGEEEGSISIVEPEAKPATQAPPVKIIDIYIVDSKGNRCNRLISHEDFVIVIEVQVLEPDRPFHLGAVIQRDDGINVFVTTTKQQGYDPVVGREVVTAHLSLPQLALLSGDYSLFIYVLDDHGIQVLDMAEGVYPFSIRAATSEMGIVALKHKWHIKTL